jgi:hypothetical protein
MLEELAKLARNDWESPSAERAAEIERQWAALHPDDRRTAELEAILDRAIKRRDRMTNETKNNPDHIEQFFEYGHLPKHLQDASKPFCDLAKNVVATLPRNPERTVALRKLLEAKDAAVRALLCTLIALAFSASAFAGGIRNMATSSNSWVAKMSDTAKAYSVAKADIEDFRSKCLLLEEEAVELRKQAVYIAATLLNARRAWFDWLDGATSESFIGLHVQNAEKGVSAIRKKLDGAAHMEAMDLPCELPALVPE